MTACMNKLHEGLCVHGTIRATPRQVQALQEGASWCQTLQRSILHQPPAILKEHLADEHYQKLVMGKAKHIKAN